MLLNLFGTDNDINIYVKKAKIVQLIFWWTNLTCKSLLLLKALFLYAIFSFIGSMTQPST